MEFIQLYKTIIVNVGSTSGHNSGALLFMQYFEMYRLLIWLEFFVHAYNDFS